MEEMAYTKEQIASARRSQLTIVALFCVGIGAFWFLMTPGTTTHQLAMADLVALAKEKNAAPIMVRLAWHDAGTYDVKSKTGGPRGTIRFQPEAGYGANKGLDKARELIAPIKDKYPHISHADLFAMGGVAAIRAAGGPSIPFRPGRVDGTPDNTAPDGRLPDAMQGAEHLRDIFYRMGFNDREIVALSGAHTLGRMHKDRSGLEGPWTHQPLVFDNSYFKLLLKERWSPARDGTYHDATETLTMAPADIALVQDSVFKEYVEIYAENDSKFRVDFSKAFQKLLELGWSGKLDAPVYPL